MDPRQSQSSRAGVAVLLAKGKLIGSLTTGNARRSSLDATDINKFHQILQVALQDDICAGREFKKCAAWIVCHVAKSHRRVAAFGDYLIKVSESFETGSGQKVNARLNVLALMDSAFARIHENPDQLLRTPLETYMTLAKGISPYIPRLFELTTPPQDLDAIHTYQALASLTDHWTNTCLFTSRLRMNLRGIARKAYSGWLEWLQQSHPTHHSKLVTKIAPEDIYLELPPTHGSSEDARYDFPTGLLLNHAKPSQPGQPYNTFNFSPLKLSQGPVDINLMQEALSHAEESLNILAIPNESAGNSQDEVKSNSLGLHAIPSKTTVVAKEGYYGIDIPLMATLEAIDRKPHLGPKKPLNWTAPAPQEPIAPPQFQGNFSSNLPPANFGDNFANPGPGSRQNDFGRGHQGGWRGDYRGGYGGGGGGGGGEWRGRGRGGGPGGPGRGRGFGGGGGGYRGY